MSKEYESLTALIPRRLEHYGAIMKESPTQYKNGCISCAIPKINQIY